MGKQISFYMDKETELAFLEYVLEEAGQLLYENENMKLVSLAALPELISVGEWYELYLYKPEYGDITLRKLTGGREYVDSTRSPVIEFSRTVVRDNDMEVTRGRLWMEMKYRDSEGNLVTKPDELDKWFSSLRRWLIKNLPVKYGNRSFVTYASASMKELVFKGYSLV